MIEIALLAIAILVITLTLGVPLPYCFGAALMVMYFIGDVTMKGMMLWGVQQLGNPILLAIPLFILAGAIMNSTGISRRLIAFASALFGFIKGGLAMVNIGASMFFAEISGSAVADVAALGSILIPAMKKEGYPANFSAAVTVASAMVGPIIPPSIGMVIYGALADVSIGRLLLAGILAGEEEERVAKTFADRGLVCRRRKIDGEWAGLVMSKPRG